MFNPRAFRFFQRQTQLPQHAQTPVPNPAHAATGGHVLPPLGSAAAGLAGLLPDLQPGESYSISEAGNTGPMLNPEMYAEAQRRNQEARAANQKYEQTYDQQQQYVQDRNREIGDYNEWVRRQDPLQQRPNLRTQVLGNVPPSQGTLPGVGPWTNNIMVAKLPPPIPYDPSKRERMTNVEPKYPYQQASLSTSRTRPSSAGANRKPDLGTLRVYGWNKDTKAYEWGSGATDTINSVPLLASQAPNANITSFLRNNLVEGLKDENTLYDLKRQTGWTNPDKPNSNATFDSAFKDLFNSEIVNNERLQVVLQRHVGPDYAKDFNTLKENFDDVVFPSDGIARYNAGAWEDVHNVMKDIVTKYLRANPNAVDKIITRKDYKGEKPIDREKQAFPRLVDAFTQYYTALLTDAPNTVPFLNQ